jgi:gliding motility-associated-like protein
MDDHSCFFDTAFVEVIVYPIPTVEIINGSSISLSTGGSVKLSTKNSPDVTRWLWTPSRGLSCNNCPSPVASPTDNIVYKLQVANDANCIARDEIMITSVCNNSNVYVPNTFSPNGDGMNDQFYPRGTGIYTIKNFRVYTRWGQLLYEKKTLDANDAAQGWNGTSAGVKMQPDVYVYMLDVICENSVVFPVKGSITLIH